MTLSELAAYAEEKYHMKEEHKWNDFTGYSVLADPDTNKWVALLMRQWDYETGTELQKCDIKCGRQIMRETDAPYVGNSFRMKGNKWVGVLIGEETDRETVFRLFDEAVRAGRSGAYTVVLERTDQNDGDGKISRDSLLPLETMRGKRLMQARVLQSTATTLDVVFDGEIAPGKYRLAVYTRLGDADRPSPAVARRIVNA